MYAQFSLKIRKIKILEGEKQLTTRESNTHINVAAARDTIFFKPYIESNYTDYDDKVIAIKNNFNHNRYQI